MQGSNNPVAALLPCHASRGAADSQMTLRSEMWEPEWAVANTHAAGTRLEELNEEVYRCLH